jgi:hypothetical protein
MKNPIDEKVDRAAHIITTSKTVLNFTNLLLLIGILTGIGFTVFCIAALFSVRQDQISEVLGFLALSVLATLIVAILYSKNKRKRKLLEEK